MKQSAAIILAAGASTRLGEPKQLVEFVGERLLERAVRTAREAGCGPVVVVLGAGAGTIQAQCSLRDATVIHNMEWKEGMASSIRAGVAALPLETESAIVMTCDQPAVTAAHLQRLMAAMGNGAVASEYSGRRGVPACFPAVLFAELAQLRGDQGAAKLLQQSPAVPLPFGEVDVDTPEGLRSAHVLFG